jgi:hypothetical protein
MIMATLLVPDGMPLQDSGMGVLLPRQENLAGILAPAATAGLRTEIVVAADGAGAVAAGAAGVLAAGRAPPPLPPHPASRTAASAATAPPLARPCPKKSRPVVTLSLPGSA